MIGKKFDVTLLSNGSVPGGVAGCRVTSDEVTTFDRVVYHPRLIDKCQYMLLATAGTYRDKLVMLLERGSAGQNQVNAHNQHHISSLLIRVRHQWMDCSRSNGSNSPN